ncbi:MAG: T9SS type A sorting domain-containing protein [Bacteroidetes bacterium]|nr:T9SS type A sorting domain-containing protein [Bacteroidota bacterium]
MSFGIHGWRVVQGFLAAAAIVTLFGNGSVTAQRFQDVIGSPNCADGGLHGVKQLAAGGYVAVGESFQQPGGCGTSDALVTVVNAAGIPVWTITYQIGVNSRATDVLELINGDLIVCGYAQIGPPCHAAVSKDIFILHLAANGGVIGFNTYGGNASDEEAWKIIRATVGNGVTTNPGDYVVAGSSTNANAPGMRGAYLLRVNAALGLIWDQQYGTAANDEYFYGLDEVPPAFAGAGDIVAAGGSTSPPALGTDIFVARVNGNTGAIGPAPQGESWTNFPNPVFNSNEEARSVIMLRNGPNAGDIVVAGFTNGAPPPNANDEVFVVEFGPNPCNQVANVYFGDNGPNPDRGYDLVEDANPPAGVASDVVVTGFTNLPGGFGGEDVFLQRVATGPGMGLVGGAGDYGGIANDEGWSVSNALHNVAGSETPGYIINGFTQSPNLIGAADPQQLFLVKTDLALNSFCNSLVIQFPRGIAPNGTVCGMAIGPNIGLQCRPNLSKLAWQWGNQLCYALPRAHEQGGNGNDGVAGVDNTSTIAFNDGSMTSYPNPLHSGDVLNLRFDLVKGATAHVVVSDISGREVYRSDIAVQTGAQLVPLNTENWQSGTYLVRVTIGGVSATSHVVVMEK